MDLYGESPACIVLSFAAATTADPGRPFTIQSHPINVDPIILRISNRVIWLSRDDFQRSAGFANMELLSFVFPKMEEDFLKLAHPRKFRN
jgi:hypothetical protein